MSRTASPSPGDEPTLTPKERYEKALRAADYQTGGPDSSAPAGVTLPALAHAATGYGRLDREAHGRAVEAAISNGDLLVWKDRDGDLRVTPTDDDSLRNLIATENGREDTSVELVERCREIIRGEDA